MNNDEMSSDEKTKSIIPVIKTELTGSVCENTGSQLTRECPQCHKTLTYTKRKSKLRADKIDGRCRSCAVSETGLTNIGKIVSKETRVRMSKSQRNRITPTPFKGKHHSDEVKRKMRISACKRVLSLQRDKGGRINNIGKKRREIFL